MPKPRQKTKEWEITQDYSAALSTEKRLMGLFHERERDSINHWEKRHWERGNEIHGGQRKTRIKDRRQEKEAVNEMVESLNRSERSRMEEKGVDMKIKGRWMDIHGGRRSHMWGMCLSVPSAHKSWVSSGGNGWMPPLCLSSTWIHTNWYMTPHRRGHTHSHTQNT